MADSRFLQFDSLSLHAGQQPDPVTGARATPIYQTTSYVFKDTDHAAALFNMERAGHIYSRIAALEGGVGAVCTASGQAALHLAIVTLMGAGGHIVASSKIYGGSNNMFVHTLPRFGIETTLVDPRDVDAFRAAIRPETRLVFTEAIGNPGMEVANLPLIAELAHEAGLPLMVDSTFTTPYLIQPAVLGVDIIMHSMTKFLGGHGTSIGGVIVDSGQFDWEASGKFPTLTEPYDGYHGLDFAEEFGPAAMIMRARAEGLRDFGACISPTNAFYILQGVETLPLRMARHTANAQAIAQHLEAHDAVDWVSYPGLPSHPDYDLAQRLLPKGAGAIFSFGIRGGREAGRKFIERLELFSHLANIGDAKSLVIHPASTTHQQMSAEALKSAGIGEELIRLSVGLEDLADLTGDLDQALKASQRG